MVSLLRTVLAVLANELVSAHGWMSKPQSRNFVDTWNKNSLGVLHSGPCGKSLIDTEASRFNYNVPFKNNPSLKMGPRKKKWEVETVDAGSKWLLKVDHTTDHGGEDSFWFLCTSRYGNSPSLFEGQKWREDSRWELLCAFDDPSQCSWKTVMGVKTEERSFHVKAPASCPEGGVLQWFWEVAHCAVEEWKNCADVIVNGNETTSGFRKPSDDENGWKDYRQKALYSDRGCGASGNHGHQNHGHQNHGHQNHGHQNNGHQNHGHQNHGHQNHNPQTSDGSGHNVFILLALLQAL